MGGRRCKQVIVLHIVKHITGGGKQQEVRAGVDYIMNFHIDNFTIVHKVIDALAPQSDVDHTLRDELCGLRYRRNNWTA